MYTFVLSKYRSIFKTFFYFIRRRFFLQFQENHHGHLDLLLTTEGQIQQFYPHNGSLRDTLAFHLTNLQREAFRQIRFHILDFQCLRRGHTRRGLMGRRCEKNNLASFVRTFSNIYIVSLLCSLSEVNCS